jgi:serine/threonine-protein kinase RsbW
MDAFQRETRVRTADDLPRVLEFMEESCRDANVDPALWFDLQLAVEEACCNVIEHAYNGEGGEFYVGFRSHDRDVMITVRDQGKPFDPASVAPPDMNLPLEDRPVGGLGLHLIHQLMDQVKFEFSDGTNTLTMIKRNAILRDKITEKEDDG